MGGTPAVAVSGYMAEGVGAVAITPSPISASTSTANWGGAGVAPLGVEVAGGAGGEAPAYLAIIG